MAQSPVSPSVPGHSAHYDAAPPTDRTKTEASNMVDAAGHDLYEYPGPRQVSGPSAAAAYLNTEYHDVDGAAAAAAARLFGDSGDEDDEGMDPVFGSGTTDGGPPPIYPGPSVEMRYSPHPREPPTDPSWSDPDCFIPQHRYHHYHNSRQRHIFCKIG